MTVVPSLKNINFMSQNRFNSLDNLSEEELYAVNIGSVLTTNVVKKSETGFLKLGNGIIFQWGVSSIPAGGSATITYPFPFSGENTYTISTGYFSPGSTRDNPIVITARTATNFTVQNKAGSGNLYCYFHAIGY